MKAFIFMVFLLACSSVNAEEKSYDMFLTQDYYEAAYPIELISTMPAPNYHTNSQRQFRRIAHVLVPDLKTGEILTIASNFEITNDLTDNYNNLVEFAAALILTPSSSGTAGIENLTSLSNSSQPSNGKFITRFPGYNLTENEKMHHGMMPLNAIYKVPDGVNGNHYVAIISYAAGVNYAPTDDVVKIEPWAGWIQVKRN